MTDAGGNQPKPDLADEVQQRMEAFGREAQTAGERLGKEAQAAGERWARDPGLVTAGTWLSRAVGLVFVAVGLWLFGAVSLRLDLPEPNWDLLWPALLVVLGAVVLLSAAVRRR
jgi:hypothetical protein